MMGLILYFEALVLYNSKDLTWLEIIKKKREYSLPWKKNKKKQNPKQTKQKTAIIPRDWDLNPSYLTSAT